MNAWDRYRQMYDSLLEAADNTAPGDRAGIQAAQDLRAEMTDFAAHAERGVALNPPDDVDIQSIGWGVEIETAAPTSTRVAAWHSSSKIQIPYLPEGWHGEADGSIMRDRETHATIVMPGYGPCEVISPILRGADGIHQIVITCEALEAHAHRITNNCGVHVTLGWANQHPLMALDRLITIVAYLEKALYACTGSRSREAGPYCQGVRKYGDAPTAKTRCMADRYHGLNLTNQGRVEFRFFSGSKNAVKICAWVQICMGLVQRALVSGRSPQWEPKPPSGGWAKKGVGQSEVERLLSYVAWPAGQAKVFGGLHFGLLSEEVPLNTMMAELRRLAKKYDSAQQASLVSA